MGKGKLRLRISRVLPSFQSCGSNKCQSAAVTPAFCLSPVNPKARDIDFPPPPLPSPTPSVRRLAPVVAAAVNCRCRPRRPNRCNPDADADADDLSRARETPAYLWRKDEKWHVVTAAADGGSSPRLKIDSDDSSVFFPPANGRAAAARVRRSRRPGGKKKPRSRPRSSTHSADSGWFFSSGEDEENDEREDDGGDGDETETLLSSFETDSSDNVLLRIQTLQGIMRAPETESPEKTAAAGTAEEKVRESFAVVKRSEDPHGDFRQSMAEMVVEKHIYDPEGLEQLLHCFLTLNSRRHHPAIVSAFSDVWEAIFPAATFPLCVL